MDKQGSTQIVLKTIDNIATVLIISRDALLKDLKDNIKDLDRLPESVGVDEIFNYLNLIMEL